MISLLYTLVTFKYIMGISDSCALNIKVGWSKPPRFQTVFYRLKLPQSISPKVVNTDQYGSEYSIGNLM